MQLCFVCLYLTPLYLLEIDPKNYLTYYKRATIYLAMGKFKSALPDLSKAIELKPDFLAVSLNFSVFLPNLSQAEKSSGGLW